MKPLYFFLLSLVLTSCGRFSDGTSVFAEGGWIVPLVPFLLGVKFAIDAYRQSKRPSDRQTPTGIVDLAPLPWYKLPRTWYAAALLLATLGIILAFNLAK